MQDPRLNQLAKNLVNYSVNLQKGEKILIEAKGVDYMLVEQDNCHGQDEFDCITRSYKYLKSCGF